MQRKHTKYGLKFAKTDLFSGLRCGMREAATGLTLADACGLKIPGSLGEGIFALPVHEFMEGSGWSESGTWNIATGAKVWFIMTF